MSIAHIERLLGWDMDEGNETNFRAMSSLLLGRETDLDPRAAQKAAKDERYRAATPSVLSGVWHSSKTVYRSPCRARFSHGPANHRDRPRLL